MKMLHISKAGPYLDILERFYIFRGAKIEVKRQSYDIYIYIYIYIYTISHCSKYYVNLRDDGIVWGILICCCYVDDL